MATKKLSKSTLRWFIGTKSLMPIVEIRRRFCIEADEVTELEDGEGKLYVGLPQGPAQALGELMRQGKVGYEFSVEFHARVVIGAYVVFGSRGHAAGPVGRHQPEDDVAPEVEASQDAA